MTRLLGIDPGSRRLGWGIVDVEGSRMQHVAHGVLAPPVKSSLAERLSIIFDGLEAVLATWAPQAAAIEQVFTAKSPKSALILGHARGAALLAVHRAGLVAGEYSPAEIKLAVAGHGRASKEQLAAMVSRLLGGGLDAMARDAQGRPAVGHDATDALAVAICHAHGRRRERILERARSAGH